MKTVRVIGDGILWVMAAVGALTGVLWVANGFGLIQPLVVVSESMQPTIRTGDLLIAFPFPVEDVSVGDVATLPSTITGNLITHRIIDVVVAGGDVALQMQGDDNDAPDGETYVYSVGDTVLRPMLTIPRAGFVVMALASPAIGVPLFVMIVAFIILAVVPSSRRDSDTGKHSDEVAAPAVDDVSERRINS